MIQFSQFSSSTVFAEFVDENEGSTRSVVFLITSSAHDLIVISVWPNPGYLRIMERLTATFDINKTGVDGIHRKRLYAALL